MKTERMQLVLTPRLDRRIRSEAARQGRSMNDLVGFAVEKYLDSIDLTEKK